jgi:glycine/D-amino acid oxidase-like deaminating enzyme
VSTENVAEIVVCGAGIAGLAAAHQLAVRARAERVVLVDAGEPLSLTSSRGTEAYRNWWPGPGDTMVRFMNRSIDLLEELSVESGGAFELNRRGYVFLTADPREAARMLESAKEIASRGAGPLREHATLADYERHRAEGFQGPAGADYLSDPRAIRELFPYVAEDTLAMLHVRRAGWMNVKKLGALLFARSVERGVRVIRDRAESIETANGRFRAVRLASGARIEARVFVLAAGPLLEEWVDRLALGVPIINEPHGKVSIEDPARIIPRDAPMLIWNDPVSLAGYGDYPAGVHFRTRGEQTVLGIWTYDHRIEKPRPSPSFEPDYPAVMIRALACMVPGLNIYFGREKEWLADGGYYCKAPDNRPLIGPLSIEGVHLLGALSGFGVMASQAGAELLAAHALGAPLPEYAPAFSIDRFRDPEYLAMMSTYDPASGQL